MKTSKDELLNEVMEDLLIYLKSGKLSIKSFINKLNLNIDSLDDLIKIHFLLDEDVKCFICKLPELIRMFKTSTITITNDYICEIKGNIVWDNTIKKRINQYEPLLYVCNEIDKLYNTKKNIVLKTFIKTVYNIIIDCNMQRFVSYEWYKDGQKINNIIKQTYEKNIYFKKINTENTIITDRMLMDVSKDRNELYSTAANLLIKLKRLLNEKNDTMIRELFSKTFIEISDIETLFELYWVIKLIKENTTQANMLLIDDKNNIIASWLDNNYLYKIYHDSTGSDKLLFRIYRDEVIKSDNEYLKRMVKSKDFSQNIAKKIGYNISDDFWRGRPDILIEKIDKKSDKIVKIIIGEVKYTSDINYMLKGLQELAEYIYLIKNTDIVDNYIIENEGNSDIEIEGILFADKVKIDKDLDFLNNITPKIKMRTM
jgi:hypothetical protein